VTTRFDDALAGAVSRRVFLQRNGFWGWPIDGQWVEEAPAGELARLMRNIDWAFFHPEDKLTIHHSRTDKTGEPLVGWDYRLVAGRGFDTESDTDTEQSEPESAESAESDFESEATN
jgi:hypothetical protein